VGCHPCRAAEGPTRPDCRAITSAERRRAGTIHSPHAVYQYLAPESMRLKRERAWLLLLSPGYELVTVGTIGEGGPSSVEIDLDWALACVRRPETAFCVLSHNHPSGSAWPSTDDDNLTQSMASAARRAGISLLDHVVLGRDEYFSFRERRLWQVTRQAKTKSIRS
jgi:DNA repair protein RadC